MYQLERQLLKGCDLGNGLIKADHFLTHKVDVPLMLDCGREFAKRFENTHPTLVLTAETSGIAPAMAAALYLQVPLLFARKHAPITMSHNTYHALVDSHTHGDRVDLTVSTEFLDYHDRVIIIDDFLATGNTIGGLVKIVDLAGAKLIGIGVVIEKVYEYGRDAFDTLGVPIHALVKVAGISNSGIYIQEQR